MNLNELERNFNKGHMTLEQIAWLIAEVKNLEEQANEMAEKHAEKDIAIEKFMNEITRLRIVEQAYIGMRLAK